MTFFVHSAENEDGNPLPESSSTWQPLVEQLRNVKILANHPPNLWVSLLKPKSPGLLRDL